MQHLLVSELSWVLSLTAVNAHQAGGLDPSRAPGTDGPLSRRSPQITPAQARTISGSVPGSQGKGCVSGFWSEFSGPNPGRSLSISCPATVTSCYRSSASRTQAATGPLTTLNLEVQR